MAADPRAPRRLSPGTLAGLVGALWLLFNRTVRDFVREELSDGLIRTRDLPRATRTAARIGFVVLIAMLALVVLGDGLRLASPLLATTGGVRGRGEHLPLLVIPIVTGVLALAWTFLLVGALRAHWALRLVALLLYLGMTLGLVSASLPLAGPGASLGLLALLLAVPVIVLVRSFGRPRPALDLGLLFAVVVTTYVVAHAQGVAAYRITAIPLAFASLDLAGIFFAGLVTPLLVLIGYDIAHFMHRSADVVSGIAAERAPHLLLYALLAGLVGWRLVASALGVRDELGELGLGELALQYVGAAAVPLVVVAAWLVFGRHRADESDDLDDLAGHAERTLPKLALAYKGWLVVTTVVFVGILVYQVMRPSTLASGAVLERVGGWMMRATDVLFSTGAWHAGFALVVLVGAIWCRRTGRTALALYLGVLAFVQGWYVLTAPRMPLAVLAWERHAQVNAVWVVAIAVVAVVWAAQRRLTVRRVQALLFVAIVVAMLAPTEAIGDPFSPFFAFAGIWFIAFGLLWDALTAGSFANGDSRRLPRASRVYLYLGYVLLTITLVAWAVLTHDLGQIAYFTGDAAAEGFAVLGRPLLYALFALLLFRGVTAGPEPEPGPELQPDPGPEPEPDPGPDPGPAPAPEPTPA